MDAVAVVGASLAGVRAAETLRREGFAGRITLVGGEVHWPPFDRPPLSKQVLDGTWDVGRARLRVELDPSSDALLDLRLGRRALSVDLAARELALDDDSAVAFDGLIIATGAAPVTLPGVQELRGVHVLRTMDDCVALRADLDGPAYVAVVGGGFIGCEVASAARSMGHPVTMVEALPLPLGRVVGNDVGGMAAALHRDHGVELHLGQGVAGLEGAQRVEGVRLVDGTVVRADVVVVGIGVAPSVDWLAGSGVIVDNGVVCDASLAAVGVEGVVACGDVARWPHPLFDNDLVRLEHWTNAAESAEHAARTLLAGHRDGAGAAEPFAEVPYFWSDQHGTKFQMVGANRAEDEAVVVEGSLDGGEDGKVRAVVAYVRGDEQRVVAALCINQPHRTIPWRAKVAERASLP